METIGVVARRRADTDERFVEVALTDGGDVLRRHATKNQCDMTAALSLDAVQFAALQDTSRTVTANLTP